MPIRYDDPEREKYVQELEAAVVSGEKEREKRAREALRKYDAYRGIDEKASGRHGTQRQKFFDAAREHQ